MLNYAEIILEFYVFRQIFRKCEISGFEIYYSFILKKSKREKKEIIKRKVVFKSSSIAQNISTILKDYNIS